MQSAARLVMSKAKSLDHEELSEKLLVLQDSKVTSRSVEYGSTIQYDFPDDYLVRSILATILFCPCGLLALLNAVKVKKMFKSGDIDGAYLASKKAQNFSTTAFQFAFFIWIFVVVVLLCVGLFGFFYILDGMHTKFS